MAWSNSKIFVATIEDALENTTALDLNDTTANMYLAALYDNSITPDQTVASANTAYDAGVWGTANEQSNGGWAAGGEEMESITCTFSSNVLTWDAADTANDSAATLADVYGCLVYAGGLTTPVADQGVSYHYFGGTQAVTSGTFTIVWNSSGIISLTL